METETPAWPEKHQLGKSIDCDGGFWSADILLIKEETEEDIAVHYLGTTFPNEEEANKAVEAVFCLPENELKKLKWVPTQTKPMRFFFHTTSPDSKHRDGSFTRHITAVTLEDPRQPRRAAFLNLAIDMTYKNQSIELIKKAIEAETGQPIELAGGYSYQRKTKNAGETAGN
jgi:hypothetical protein